MNAGVGASGGIGSGVAATLTGSEAAEQIWNFLRNDMGLSPELTAGILGNWQQENNLSPDETKGGLGIMQWTGQRRKNCIDMFPSNYQTLGAQLSFFKWEATSGSSGEEGYWQDVLSSDISTPESAAYNFCFNYERPGTPMVENRQSYARQFYSMYNK